MIDVERIGPHAVAITVSGTIGRAELDAAFEALASASEADAPIDLLVHVAAPFDVAWLETLAAEIARAKDALTLFRAARRIAVVADPA